MKGHFATLAAVSSMALFAGNVVAHPGHSPADVTAELAAPLAGPDHLMVFGSVAVLGLLAAGRVAMLLAERRRAQKLNKR